MSDTEEFTVTWTVQVTAASHIDAATIALEMQRDPHGTATVFEVESATVGPITIDLGPYDDSDNLPAAIWAVGLGPTDLYIEGIAHTADGWFCMEPATLEQQEALLHELGFSDEEIAAARNDPEVCNGA